MEISSTSQSSYFESIANRPTPPPRKLSTEPLSDEQKDTLESILSEYDSSEASPEVMDAIFSDMKDAGIPMSEDTQSILKAEGFGPPDKPSGPPPPQDSMAGLSSNSLGALNGETRDTLIDLVESFLSGEMDQTAFDSEIETLGLEDVVGNLFNQQA